jgi:hypothetical protein
MDCVGAERGKYTRCLRLAGSSLPGEPDFSSGSMWRFLLAGTSLGRRARVVCVSQAFLLTLIRPVVS